MIHCQFAILPSAIAAILFTLAISPLTNLARASEPWIDQFKLLAPEANRDLIADFQSSELPTFTVTPAATGEQFVRLSLPFAAGALADGDAVQVVTDGKVFDCGWRVVTHHPGTPIWVRRGIVSFDYAFQDSAPVMFSLRRVPPTPSASGEPPSNNPPMNEPLTIGPVRLKMEPTGVTLRWTSGQTWHANVVGPNLSSDPHSLLETVEHNSHYLWLRLLVADPLWPRIIEVRADRQGQVLLHVQLQRREPGDAYAPALGWQLQLSEQFEPQPPHSFSDGQACSIAVAGHQVSFPLAALNRKGQVAIDGNHLTYLRCTDDDRTPMQSTAWRSAAMAIGPVGAAPVSPLLVPAHKIEIPPSNFDALYGVGAELNLSPWPEIDSLRQFTRDGIVSAALRGDDAGNVTSFGPGQSAGVFGMNRLNHCPAIFEEYYRSSDSRLRETGVLWCENMHDLSIWWETDEFFGGTRYNNSVANGEMEHAGDNQFMWRTNGGQHSFCTKGYDSFYYAWEESGDPRMATALRHQVAYASRHVHVNRGEARNIGDAADFVRLYRFTGQPEYLDQALRLWRQLREVLGEDGLFSQSGKPIVAERPFIDDDAAGYQFPFAKPYIIGYGLAGCPWLIETLPDEPRLQEMVTNCAKMLAASVDPAGGWRYPAPESSVVLISQGIEHAAQMARAADALEKRGVDTSDLLDAIEIVLQARLNGWRRTRLVLGGLSGWEQTNAPLASGETLQDRYPRPADRNRSLDYDQGAVSVGGAPPEGLVYFSEVLAFYLRHRPAEPLFQQSPELRRVLARTSQAALQDSSSNGNE